MKLRLFDYKLQKIITIFAEKYKIDKELAAEIIYDFEYQLRRSIKTGNNMRVPEIGLFHLSYTKVKQHGKKEMLFKTHPELSPLEDGEQHDFWDTPTGDQIEGQH